MTTGRSLQKLCVCLFTCFCIYLNALRAVRHRALSALMRSVLDSMLVTVVMLILCICSIWDSGAGGELSASRIDIPQAGAYFRHVFNTCKMF